MSSSKVKICGPVNRWSFSHLREVLPTANIEHDGRQVLKLDYSKADHSNVSISVRGEDRPIDDIADEFQYRCPPGCR